MNRLAATALAALAAAVAGSAALAQDAPEGRVTLAQFQARREARLTAMDTDHDGKVSKAEFTAAMQARGGRRAGMADAMFARQDLNGDGFITRDEVDKSAADMFAQMDPDHTGYVDMSQMRGMHGRR
ncbi:MAG: EF-hand domain-containing protein [Caulobacteraceae bacterium]